MDQLKVFKGKAGSMSAPSFSMRYSAEGEEIEQLYDPVPPEKPEESKAEEKKVQEEPASTDGEKKGRDSPFLSKLNRRTGSLEEGETWRFLTDIKGRITKTVGEKIDEISKKKKGPGGLGSSLSDSEERSESSSVKEEEEVVESSAEKSVRSQGEEEEEEEHESEGWSDGTPRPSSDSTTPEPSQRPTRRRRRKTAERIEVGVEAVESELSASVISNESIGSTGPLEAFPGPGLFAALQTWAPLVLPALLAVIHHTMDISPFVKGLLFGVMAAVEVMYLRERVACVFGREDPEMETMPRRSSSFFDTSPIFTEATFYAVNKQPHLEIHEGWMNEFKEEYDPSIYHIALTETVWVRVDGSCLRLGSTRQRVSKRAFWSEDSGQSPPNITHERAYNLVGAQVSLLPQGLAHKRLWSKKYPICIKLTPGSLIAVRGKTPPIASDNAEKNVEPTEKASPKKNKEHDISSEPVDSVVSDISSGIPNDRPLDDDEQEDVLDDDEELDSEYVQVDDSLVNRSNIYLFARSDREKEIWYRRLVEAVDCKNKVEGCERDGRLKREQSYIDFMKRIGKIKRTAHLKSRHKSKRNSDVWVNALLGRMMYDVLIDPLWLGKIQEKIQRKLSAIKIPVFMEELVVSSLEFGDTIPVIERSSEPVINERGLWVDLELSYQGSFSMTVDTKINIMKLKTPPPPDSHPTQSTVSKPAIFDSGAEDSAESSSEETAVVRTMAGAPPKKKMLRVVDKIAASKYFQQVTDNKYVKRALEGVSNTNISLIVQVKGLIGTLVLNIPPPPSNRLWYGFRAKPKLLLSVQPKWGEHTINMLNMTSWIEKKLYQEFQKLLVLPNMDDLVIPVMSKDLPS